MEENAEDIASNDENDIDNEDDEDELFSIFQKEGFDFIVPDGHLSENEINDENLIEERKLFENSKSKNIDIKTILNIRKNYIKPIIIDFTKKEKNENNENANNEKILVLTKKLTIGLFYFNENERFPIIINNKAKKYKCIQDSVKNHIKDFVKIIHGSYETKEHLISELIKKYNDIYKNNLNNFFKEKCIKISKKYWIVKNDVLNEFDLNEKEIEQIKKDNYNAYKEKEEKKSKKLIEPIFSHEENNNNNINYNINNKENIFNNDKPKKLDKLLLNKKDYDEISIEILDNNYYISNEIDIDENNNKNKNRILKIFRNDDENRLNNDKFDKFDIKEKKQNMSLITYTEKTENIKKKMKKNKNDCYFDIDSSSVDIKKNKKRNRTKKNSKCKIKMGKMSKIEKNIKNEDNKSKKRNNNNKLINEYFFFKNSKNGKCDNFSED